MLHSILLRLCFLATLILCFPLASAGQSLPEQEALLAEAAQFMEGYATDLRDGDRNKLANRYDRNGVYELRPGEKRFTSHSEISSRYTGLGQTRIL